MKQNEQTAEVEDLKMEVALFQRRLNEEISKNILLEKQCEKLYRELEKYKEDNAELEKAARPEVSS